MTLGPVFDAALAAQEACEKIGLKYCAIDGVALQRWGEPRFTARDKDWADVTSILERLGPHLGLDLVREELQPLVAAKDEPEILQQLERRIARILGPKP